MMPFNWMFEPYYEQWEGRQCPVCGHMSGPDEWLCDCQEDPDWEREDE
jgi:hypothetical protein